MSSTVNSKSKSEEEPRFVIHRDTVFTAGRPSGEVEWGELVVPQRGRLEGFDVHVRYELRDGLLLLTEISHRPHQPMPHGAATNRALQDLRLGDVPAVAETCLRHVAKRGYGLNWLEAFTRARKRPGRAGTPRQTHALVALRRVEAERDAPPRKAIRYMVATWPELFASQSAATSKVNKATRAGMLEHTAHGLRLTDEARELLDREADQ